MLGSEFCKRIDYRREHISDIISFHLQNNKFPPDSCKDKIISTLFSLPPKCNFDYSLPFNNLSSTISHIIRFFCSLYLPSCAFTREKMSSITSSGLIGLNKNETVRRASDCSIPKSKRSTFTLSNEYNE